MAFTAQDVKKLREMTNVGMMDCKKALQATDGDMDKAVDWLREKGLAKAAKKADRIAAEGVAYAAVFGGVGVVIEVNSETDFAAKTDAFLDLVKNLAQVVAEQNPADVEALKTCTYPNSKLTVTEIMQEKVMSIGENIQIRRFARFADNTSVAYVHAGGTHGVLVNLAVEGDIDVTELGKNVAMQIAAMGPKYWDKTQYNPSEVETIVGDIDYTDIYEARKEAWVKGRATMARKKYRERVDWLQQECADARNIAFIRAAYLNFPIIHIRIIRF